MTASGQLMMLGPVRKVASKSNATQPEQQGSRRTFLLAPDACTRQGAEPASEAAPLPSRAFCVRPLSALRAECAECAKCACEWWRWSRKCGGRSISRPGC